MLKLVAIAVVLAVTAAACVEATDDDLAVEETTTATSQVDREPDTGDVSVTETTTIVFELDDQTYTVTRPVGCDAEPGSPTDLDAEPAQWLAFGDYKRWSDAEGCPVRVDVISNINGAAHCELQDAEFISIGRPLGAPVTSLSPATANRYVWNANGVIPGLPPGETVPTSALPDTGFDTGYIQGESELWLDAADESVLFVVDGDTTRVFVRDFEAGICA
jgi:hypothetical protein